VGEWLKPADCKSARLRAYEGSNPSRPTKILGISMCAAKRDRTEYNKQWYAENKSVHLANVRNNHRKLKLEVMSKYGTVCSCCSEAELDFLAVDHIDGGGNDHRKIAGSGTRFYAWLRREGYPEGFQVLCHNCNFSKHVNGGTCAHNRK
jgi:hypothetical protein